MVKAWLAAHTHIMSASAFRPRGRRGQWRCIRHTRSRGGKARRLRETKVCHEVLQRTHDDGRRRPVLRLTLQALQRDNLVDLQCMHMRRLHLLM